MLSDRIFVSEMNKKMIRKIIKIVATILSIVLIAAGLYKVLVTGSNDWGLIIVGAFFLLAVGPDAYDSIKH